MGLLSGPYRAQYGNDPLGGWALATRGLGLVVALVVPAVLLPAVEGGGARRGRRRRGRARTPAGTGRHASAACCSC
ncbi:hypothetical protein PQR15_13650 [Streptomyces lydicus]|nr:hypothetical protein [Streptomyces lydicus]